MRTTVQAASVKRVPMTALRRTALIAGLCYVITFLTSIPTLVLYGSVRKSGFILGNGSITATQWGAFIEVLLALSGIATAVVLYPVVKRQNQAAALGFVTSRLLEGAMIFVGILSLLTVITLRQNTGGTDPTSLVTTGKSLVALHDWTFLLGQGLMPGVNALLLGSLLYRSRLVPRAIPLLGLIGAPLLLASDAATIFGIWDQVSSAAFVCALPVALWEFSVGVWMAVKGFTPSPITTGAAAPIAAEKALIPA